MLKRRDNPLMPTVVLLSCLLLRASSAVADDAAALTARLRATEQATSIDTADLQPWHLKMDVQLFDDKGKPTEQGTIEEWWASRDLWRITYALPSYSGTKLHNKNGMFRTKGGAFEPGTFNDLLDQIVHPVRLAEINIGKPDLRKKQFGKVDLECIMLDQPLKGVAFPPLGLFPTYCTDPDQNDLRITTELGSLMFVRNRIGTFQGRSVTFDISGQSDNQAHVVSGHVTTLETQPLTEADFVPGDDLAPTGGGANQVGAATMAGRIISQTQPIYPADAKQNHISGTVKLHAIIGHDGRIESLHIVSADDASLAMSAVAAVRRWIYKPYVLNGETTEVETTITVNFVMKP